MSLPENVNLFLTDRGAAAASDTDCAVAPVTLIFYHHEFETSGVFVTL